MQRTLWKNITFFLSRAQNSKSHWIYAPIDLWHKPPHTQQLIFITSSSLMSLLPLTPSIQMRCPKNPVMTPITLTSNYPLPLCSGNYDIFRAGLWPRFLFLTQRDLACDSHLINVYWTCKLLSKQESEWIFKWRILSHMTQRSSGR